jgi:hypothetical protein
MRDDGIVRGGCHSSMPVPRRPRRPLPSRLPASSTRVPETPDGLVRPQHETRVSHLPGGRAIVEYLGSGTLGS